VTGVQTCALPIYTQVHIDTLLPSLQRELLHKRMAVDLAFYFDKRAQRIIPEDPEYCRMVFGRVKFALLVKVSGDLAHAVCPLLGGKFLITGKFGLQATDGAALFSVEHDPVHIIFEDAVALCIKLRPLMRSPAAGTGSQAVGRIAKALHRRLKFELLSQGRPLLPAGDQLPAAIQHPK